MKPFGQTNGSIYLNSHVYPMPINEHDMSCYITTSRLQKLSRSQKYNEKSIRRSDSGQMYNTGSEKFTLLSSSRRQISVGNCDMSCSRTLGYNDIRLHVMLVVT